MSNPSRSHETIIIGGGQAGLVTGYYLQQQGRDYVILDANKRIGDAWRTRWDSLRLFTPARYNGLPGMPFPGPARAYPTKDEMADYLEAYAARFRLPVQTAFKVDNLSRRGDQFVLTASDLSTSPRQSVRFEAKHVVVAMSNWQKPRIPPFARELDAGIIQMHSSEYRNLSQLRDGGVLIVGSGNSGAEIALETIRAHPTWIAGKDIGHVPFRIEGVVGKLILVPLVLRVLFHRIMTVNTPIGRKFRPKLLKHAMPLLRVKPKDLAAAGVKRVGRVVGVRDGWPLLEDGRVLDVANVIWCTGFDPGFSWIDLPVLGTEEPLHERGVVTNQPGLYFVGLHFLYAASSGQIQGVSRDAEYIVKFITAQASAQRPTFDERMTFASSNQEI